MNSTELVDRARSQLGLGTVYTLGRGGYKPALPTACDSRKRCDCSGFAAWCHGVSRKIDPVAFPWYRDQNGGWFETTAIFRDLAVPFGMFDPEGIPRPGMVLVWGDRGAAQGHMGIISAVDLDGVVRKVIHCSKGNYSRTGDAIQETGPEIFIKSGALVARCAFIDYEA